MATNLSNDFNTQIASDVNLDKPQLAVGTDGNGSTFVAYRFLPLADVLHELNHDPRSVESQTLRTWHGKLVTRLRHVVQSRLAKSAREPKADSQPALAPAAVDASEDRKVASIRELAGLVAAQVANAGAQFAGQAAVPFALPPNNLPAKFQAQPAQDYGPQLVDLIQQVISPGSWVVNGGNATIVYFAPRQALVVRAPSEVHHQLGGLVRDLRKPAE